VVPFQSLHTNLPTAIMQLKEFPFQNGVASFPSHSDVLTYLQNYSKHYEVDQFVRLNSAVTSISKVAGQWKVGVNSKEKGQYDEEFDRLVVCNGHFSKPSLATIKGIEHFKGTVSHSRSYRTPEPYKGKVGDYLIRDQYVKMCGVLIYNVVAACRGDWARTIGPRHFPRACPKWRCRSLCCIFGLRPECG
jgi:hypothetical protein